MSEHVTGNGSDIIGPFPNHELGEVFFLGYGSICTYQFKTLKNLSNVCRLKGTYYQPFTERKTFSVSSEDFGKIVKFEYRTLERFNERLPKILYKIIEYSYIIFAALFEILKAKNKNYKNLVLTGWALLPLIIIAKVTFRRVYLWKFGIAEELLLTGGLSNKLYYHLIKLLEIIFYRFADSFIVQSPGMAIYVEKLAGTQKPHYMVPCVADKDMFAFNDAFRRKTREELKLENKFVIVNLGSFNPWQDVDGLLKVFKSIQSLKENAFLFLITADERQYISYLKKHGVDNYQLLHAHHKDVPRLLWASDLALLIRIRDPVIHVQSPIKYAEYLIAGLPVILTDGVGVYSEYTKANQLGYVVDPQSSDVENQLKHYLSKLPCSCTDREQISKLAIGHLSNHTVREILRRIAYT